MRPTVSLSSRAQLRDGTPIRIRAIGPTDLDALRHWFGSVSPESRYLRFHGNVSSLSDAQWRYLTAVDGRDHVGMAAFLRGKIVGVGHVIRTPEAPESAEFALLVSDELQRLGVGSVLRDRLVQAAYQQGIRILLAHVLEENQAMRQLLRAGPFASVKERPGLIEVALRAPAPPDLIPRSWRRWLTVLLGLPPRWLRARGRPKRAA